MTIDIILKIYFVICFITLLTTALLMLDDTVPAEIDNFYDWLFYGLFWILLFVKHLIKFIIKLIKI